MTGISDLPSLRPEVFSRPNQEKSAIASAAIGEGAKYDDNEKPQWVFG